MTLNKRERVLMIATGVAAAGALRYVFGVGDVLDQFSQQSTQLEAAEKQYVDALETLKNAPAIMERYRALEGLMPPAPAGKRLDLMFTEDLVTLARGMNVRPEPAEYEEIPGSEQFEYVTSRLRTEGNLDSIVTLLKAMDSRGLLFREVELLGSRDQETIRANIRVARIAPVPEDVIKARQKETKSTKPRKSEGYE